MSKLLRWISERFSKNIQIRLTGYFLLILLPLVVVSLFAIEKSRDILYELAVERTQVALSSTMDYIDLALQNVEEISTVIAADPSIIDLLNKNGSNLPPEAIVDFSLILKQLSNLNSVNRFLSQISVYHQSTHMLISTDFGGRRITSEPQQEWLVEASRANGTGLRYMLADTQVAGGTTLGTMLNTDSLSLARAMDLYNTDRQSNLLIMTFNKNKLLSVIKTLLPSASTRITLLNERGEVVVGTDPRGNTEEQPISDNEMAVTIDSEYSLWRLTLVQPKKELYEETDQLRMFTYTIIAISILLAVGTSWVVYSGIASPVHKLSRGMKQLSNGKLNTRLENKRKDEFGFLIDSFNQMAMYQKHLIEDHYEQQLRMTTTELKFLQSQINPHFLYNTLDSIYWMAKNYDAEEISEMVMNLSKFFRLSLNKGEEVFPIQESLAHLHYYIRIQQLRFLDNFMVEYQITEESKPVLILKLMLQPLVENAILHGMEGRISGGLLSISSWIDNNQMVHIRVKDNGLGMEGERLHYIQNELKQMGMRSFPSLSQDEEIVKDLFGLRNVYTRMRLYYGKQSDMTISSVQGEGTMVTLSIPLDHCRENLQHQLGHITS
ncbi:sensor histidine kinase [Paenibacillus sp. FA6]|uniref:sensor histidine kinase n=1 Tax=Paenibacillus sp. FA6 TaxID=3413029 RepID=UPI003F65E629